MFAGDTIPSDRLNEIGTQYADQTHVNALTADWYFALNTQSRRSTTCRLARRSTSPPTAART